ncbi:hypothetical protein PINS_up006717 [Pythium insidiosum]|nr:hypothetical protein PINS_up006717 [Pythium insidiosum]
MVYSLHALCAAYFVVAGMVYWGIPSTFLTWYIELYSLTIPLIYYHKIAVAHYVLASLHFFGLVYPVLGVVYAKASRSWRGLKRRSAVAPNGSGFDDFDNRGSGFRSFQQSTHRLMAVPRKAHRVLFANHGLFGVESRHFEVVFLTREVVETLLQTYQAYRMSILLPRAALNRSYVALLVLNCWTTPLLHYMVPHNMVLQRTLCILADTLLDYASSVGVSTVLALTYVHLYNPDLRNFPSLFWYEDTWFVNLIIESRIFLFNSWLDAGSRLLFSLSLLVGLHDVKELLAHKPKNDNASTPSDKKQRRRSVESSFHHSKNLSARRVIYAAMVLYGIAIAALQLHAESKGRPASCVLEVRPWFVKNQACAFAELSCHPRATPHLDIGRAEEITTMLDKLHAPALTYLTIRHCSAVEMPSRVQSFPALIGVKLYNCTIATWPPEAAFDKHAHASLRFFFGIRTNFPNNTIPDGLMSPHFPPQLTDIELAFTNLEALPDNLDAYWPQGMTLFLESGRFNHVPPVIYKLQPFMLVLQRQSVVCDPIRTADAEGVIHSITSSSTRRLQLAISRD